MNRKVLIIGADWEQVSLIETAKKMGFYVIVTHPNINAEGFKISDQFYVKDSRDIQGHLKIAQTHKIDAVVTDNCDYSLYTASVIASKLDLPFTSIESALLSNDKFAQRQNVSSTKVKQPKFVRVQTLTELINAVPKIGFPAILKPIDSRGSFGVTILQDMVQLKTAFYNAIDNSPSRTLIFEQFIEGTLVTVDGFCFKNGHQSLTVASRKFENGPKPITKEIIYPARFDKKTNMNLMDAHQKVVHALGYKFGHTHGEYILTAADEIYLVECTNRGGGVYTSSTILPILTSYPINECLINQSLGIDNFAPENKGVNSMKGNIMLTFIDYLVGEVIEEINLDGVINLPFVVKFRSKYTVNEMIESIENGAGRHSMLVLSARNYQELKSNLDTVRRTLKIKYHNI